MLLKQVLKKITISLINLLTSNHIEFQTIKNLKNLTMCCTSKMKVQTKKIEEGAQ